MKMKMKTEIEWKKAKHIKKAGVHCPQCGGHHATFRDMEDGKMTYSLVSTHELDDCFIHVCAAHNIVWREVKGQ